MSSTPDSFESYITQTRTSEEQAAADAVQADVLKREEFLGALRDELKAALDEDDRRKAIRIAHRLLEEDDEEDAELDALYHFLLSRVGVPRREPYFVISMQPLVQTFSAICVLIPLIFLAAHLLSPASESQPQQSDALTFIVAAIGFGAPLIDVGIASAWNYFHRHRLIDPRSDGP